MLIRSSLSFFSLLILLLCSGCQDAATPAPPAVTATKAATAAPTAASTSPPPATPTEAPAPLADGSAVRVPRGGAATIDGTLSPGEWEGARVEIFADGSELLLMHSDGYLYLGIRSKTPEMIVGNIHLYRGLERGLIRGEEIAILHASAALGTAVYGREGANWQQTQAFEWRCRQTGNSEAAQAERQAFLEQERWLAGNAQMGTPNELEYQIEVMGDSQRLAVNFLRASDPDSKIPWPTGLDDDCIKPTPGGLPADMHFSPEEWGTIVLLP